MLKKVKKKKLIIVFVCLFLLLAGGLFGIRFLKPKTDSVKEEEIVLKAGQALIYGQITSIYGNGITYDVTKEEKGTKEPGKVEKQQSGFEGDGPQMSFGKNTTSSPTAKGEAIVQIPVGTQVTTRLGTVTTFSRLAAGDNIKMLVQEDGEERSILEVWIVD